MICIMRDFRFFFKAIETLTSGRLFWGVVEFLWWIYWLKISCFLIIILILIQFKTGGKNEIEMFKISRFFETWSSFMQENAILTGRKSYYYWKKSWGESFKGKILIFWVWIKSTNECFQGLGSLIEKQKLSLNF